LRNCLDSKKHVIGVLDHWVNYEMRWGESKPREIWVTDEYAFVKAKRTFVNSEIHLKSNYYFKEVEKQFTQNYSYPSNSDALYLCEVQKNIANHHGHQSFCVCQDVLRIRSKFLFKTIFVRPHPSYSVSECMKYFQRSGFVEVVLTAENENLSTSLARTSNIFGNNTYAMYIASLLKLNVITLTNYSDDWAGPRFVFIEDL